MTQTIQLNHLVQEIVDLTHSLLPTYVVVQLELAEDLPMFEANLVQLRLVILNLLINAAEATHPPFGLVSLHTVAVELSPEAINMLTFGNAIAPGAYVCLQVQDNGSGVDEATTQRIFEPFFTATSTDHKLALSALLGFLRLHRAALHMASQSGHGTTFQVYFPINTIPTPLTNVSHQL